MVHTLPDYSTKYKMAKVFGQIDTGELAVRLGAISSFDRRGNVLWMDNFEEATIGWEVSYTGGAGNTFLSTNRWLHGGQSLYLEPDTDDDDRVSLIRNLSYPTLGRMGFEASMTCIDTVKFISLFMRVYDGVHYHESGFGYWKDTDQLTFLGPLGLNVPFKDGITTEDDDRLFLHFKYVYDYTTAKYVRGNFNGVDYDMSTLSGQIEDDAIRPYLRLYIVCDCAGTGLTYTYLDSVILTQNEP